MALRHYLLAAMFIWLIGCGHVEAQQIDCGRLGIDLSAFIKLKAVSRSDPSAPPAAGNPRPTLNELRQQASDGHLKHLEPVLTEEEVLACFANTGRELIFLRNSIENQRQRFRAEKRQNKTMFLIVEITTILLGALATVMIGIGTNPRWLALKSWAIIPTALVTAIGAFSAVQDYRGEVSRTARAESDLSKLETEIEITLLETATRGDAVPFKIEPAKLAQWWGQADRSIKGVDDDWLVRFNRDTGPK